MKKLLTALLLSFILFSCTDTGKQEKDLLNEVIKTHDLVMAKDEQLMQNKMQLDTLLKVNKSPQVIGMGIQLQKDLALADSKMEDWMHNFDAENKGKSHQELMDYLAGQKKQIEAIDKQLSLAVNASGQFLKQNPTK